MINTVHCRRKFVYKAINAFILMAFLMTSIIPPTYAQAIRQVNASVPLAGSLMQPGIGFTPAMLEGVKINPKNPLDFEFILDTGDSDLQGEELRKEGLKLVKYFLATLTVPEDDLWVNLSPYEKNRIIPNEFGKTDMGRDLLAQDYILKQLTASLLYPENEMGKKFWEKIEAKVGNGLKPITTDLFHKIWIVPDRATVYEHNGTAVVVDSHLRVMLEEDLVAYENSREKSEDGRNDQLRNASHSTLPTSSLRETILPAIEKEVNEGKNFALLRQVYNSMILAVWFKKNLQETLLSKVYVDQNKVKGIDQNLAANNQKIYDQYVETFRQGAYNMIKEDYDPVAQEVVQRKYITGGFGGRSLYGVHRTITNPSGPDQAMINRVMEGKGRGKKLGLEINLIENMPGGPDGAMTASQGPTEKKMLSRMGALRELVKIINGEVSNGLNGKLKNADILRDHRVEVSKIRKSGSLERTLAIELLQELSLINDDEIVYGTADPRSEFGTITKKKMDLKTQEGLFRFAHVIWLRASNITPRPDIIRMEVERSKIEDKKDFAMTAKAKETRDSSSSRRTSRTGKIRVDGKEYSRTLVRSAVEEGIELIARRHQITVNKSKRESPEVFYKEFFLGLLVLDQVSQESILQEFRSFISRNQQIVAKVYEKFPELLGFINKIVSKGYYNKFNLTPFPNESLLGVAYLDFFESERLKGIEARLADNQLLNNLDEVRHEELYANLDYAVNEALTDINLDDDTRWAITAELKTRFMRGLLRNPKIKKSKRNVTVQFTDARDYHQSNFETSFNGEDTTDIVDILISLGIDMHGIEDWGGAVPQSLLLKSLHQNKIQDPFVSLRKKTELLKKKLIEAVKGKIDSNSADGMMLYDRYELKEDRYILTDDELNDLLKRNSISIDSEQAKEILRIYKIKQEMLLRGPYIVALTKLPDFFVEEFVRVAYKNGIDVFRTFVADNDVREINKVIEYLQKLGLQKRMINGVEVSVRPFVQPVIHWTNHFVGGEEKFVFLSKLMLDQLDKGGVRLDALVIKDAPGIITPKDSFSLVKALRVQFPEIPIEFHSHATGGEGHLNLLEAMRANGSDAELVVDLSLGPEPFGQPRFSSFKDIVEGTPWEGSIKVEKDKLEKAELKIKTIVEKYSPLDDYPLYIKRLVVKAGLPGGMFTNFVSTRVMPGLIEMHSVANQFGIEMLTPKGVDEYKKIFKAKSDANNAAVREGKEKPFREVALTSSEARKLIEAGYLTEDGKKFRMAFLEEFLKEMVRVTEDLGNISRVTPYSQWIGIQAYKNTARWFQRGWLKVEREGNKFRLVKNQNNADPKKNFPTDRLAAYDAMMPELQDLLLSWAQDPVLRWLYPNTNRHLVAQVISNAIYGKSGLSSDEIERKRVEIVDILEELKDKDLSGELAVEGEEGKLKSLKDNPVSPKLKRIFEPYQEMAKALNVRLAGGDPIVDRRVIYYFDKYKETYKSTSDYVRENIIRLVPKNDPFFSIQLTVDEYKAFIDSLRREFPQFTTSKEDAIIGFMWKEGRDLFDQRKHWLMTLESTRDPVGRETIRGILGDMGVEVAPDAAMTADSQKGPFSGHPTFRDVRIVKYLPAEGMRPRVNVFEGDGFAKKMAREMADTLIENNRVNKNTLWILFTGSTSEPVYEKLREIIKNENLDVSRLITFNLDEYVGLDVNHPRSYRQHMDKHLFKLLLGRGLKEENIHFFNGKAEDIDKERERIESEFRKAKSESGKVFAGGGLGTDVHVAFIEPKIGIDKKFMGSLRTSEVNKNKIRDFNEFVIEADGSEAIKDILGNVLVAHHQARNNQGFETYVKEQLTSRSTTIEGVSDLVEKLRKQTVIVYVRNLDKIKTEVEQHVADILRQNNVSFRVEFKDADEVENGLTRFVRLALPTILDNARFFDSLSQMPTEALSLDIGTIKQADKVRIVVNGAKKANALAAAISSRSVERSATLLQGHPDFVFNVDTDAAAQLQGLQDYTDAAMFADDDLSDDNPGSQLPPNDPRLAYDKEAKWRALKAEYEAIIAQNITAEGEGEEMVAKAVQRTDAILREMKTIEEWLGYEPPELSPNQLTPQKEELLRKAKENIQTVVSQNGDPSKILQVLKGLSNELLNRLTRDRVLLKNIYAILDRRVLEIAKRSDLGDDATEWQVVFDIQELVSYPKILEVMVQKSQERKPFADLLSRLSEKNFNRLKADMIGDAFKLKLDYPELQDSQTLKWFENNVNAERARRKRGAAFSLADFPDVQIPATKKHTVKSMVLAVSKLRAIKNLAEDFEENAGAGVSIGGQHDQLSGEYNAIVGDDLEVSAFLESLSDAAMTASTQGTAKSIDDARKGILEIVKDYGNPGVILEILNDLDPVTLDQLTEDNRVLTDVADFLFSKRIDLEKEPESDAKNKEWKAIYGVHEIFKYNAIVRGMVNQAKTNEILADTLRRLSDKNFERLNHDLMNNGQRLKDKHPDLKTNGTFDWFKRNVVAEKNRRERGVPFVVVGMPKANIIPFQQLTPEQMVRGLSLVEDLRRAQEAAGEDEVTEQPNEAVKNISHKLEIITQGNQGAQVYLESLADAAILSRLKDVPDAAPTPLELLRLHRMRVQFQTRATVETAAILTHNGLRGSYWEVLNALKITDLEAQINKLIEIFTSIGEKTGEKENAQNVLKMLNAKKKADGTFEAISDKDKKMMERSIKEDISDVLAKRIYNRAANDLGMIMMVRVSEGFGRDEVAESFKARDVIVADELIGEADAINQAIKKGLGFYYSKAGKFYPIIDAVIDVIEGTTKFTTNSDGKTLAQVSDSESGGTSVLVTGQGVKDLGNSPDGYVGQFYTNLGSSRDLFKNTKVTIDEDGVKTEFSLSDPELYARKPEMIFEYLKFLASVRGQDLSDLKEEIVIMKRKREDKFRKSLEKIKADYNITGLVITQISDGTVAHGLKAVMPAEMYKEATGQDYGIHKTMLTIGGSAEGFMVMAIAGALQEQGAVGELRAYSGKMNTDEKGVEVDDHSQRYNFRTDKDPEKDEIISMTKAREDYGDADAILRGQKSFKETDVKNEVSGTFSFITANGVFHQPGVEIEAKDDKPTAKVPVLRIYKENPIFDKSDKLKAQIVVEEVDPTIDYQRLNEGFPAFAAYQGKVVTIKGAGGVGGEIIEPLINAGARVVVSDVNAKKVAALKKKFALYIASKELVIIQEDEIGTKEYTDKIINPLESVPELMRDANIDHVDVFITASFGPFNKKPGTLDRLIRAGVKYVVPIENNALKNPIADAEYLQSRGVTINPDYRTNSGGLRGVGGSLGGDVSSRGISKALFDQAFDIELKSKKENRTSHVIAAEEDRKFIESLEQAPALTADKISQIEAMDLGDGTKARMITSPEGLSDEAKAKWDNHYGVMELTNEALGYKAYVAIHRLTKIANKSKILDGQYRAIGGTRMQNVYKTDDDALIDALELSKEMSFKNAGAKLKIGGSKSAIRVKFEIDPSTISDENKAKKDAVLDSYSAAIEAMGKILGGGILTGQDMNISIENAKRMFVKAPTSITPYVAPEYSIAPTFPTAVGAFATGAALISGSVVKSLINIESVLDVTPNTGDVAAQLDPLIEAVHKTAEDFGIRRGDLDRMAQALIAKDQRSRYVLKTDINDKVTLALFAIKSNDVIELRNALVEILDALWQFKDSAMIATAKQDVAPGGIKLDPKLLNLQIKRDGNGVPLPVNLQPVGQMKIEGFTPVIIKIRSINLPLLMGFNTKGSKELLSQERSIGDKREPIQSLAANDVSLN